MQYFKSAFFNEPSTVDLPLGLWQCRTLEIQDYRVVSKISTYLRPFNLVG